MTHAIFLSGPIGAGKTTLGRAVAGKMGAAFLDGDDFADHRRPWFASTLSTSQRIANAALGALQAGRVAVVAYPLRRTNYVYFRRCMTDAGHRLIVVTLRASVASILAATRGRQFDAGERGRIAKMIEEGYADRPFSDLIVDTDAGGFDETVETLMVRLKPLLV